ncbi:hypothetical protein [Spiroplasma endosymbiont of Atherix ibis]|uniref:hypothetical protein n=1 Tax=Spiroplasma endosymbiont of Atherix ibis TaxID=3066291 RepID=UPI0030D18253
MANKKTKNISNNQIDDTVSLAMEELLELAILEFKNNENLENNKNNSNNLDLKIEYNDDEKDFNPTDLSSIIIHAKKVEQKNNQLKLVDPYKKVENDIISKAKNEGKSIYDADVLRELLLQRQKKKYETEGLSSIINKIKK